MWSKIFYFNFYNNKKRTLRLQLFERNAEDAGQKKNVKEKEKEKMTKIAIKKRSQVKNPLK